MSKFRSIIRKILPFRVRNSLYPYFNIIFQILGNVAAETRNRYQYKLRVVIDKELNSPGSFEIKLHKLWLKFYCLLFGLIFLIYLILRKVYLLIWVWALRFRYLIPEYENNPTFKSLIVRRLFDSLFAIANLHYRRAFIKYDKYARPLNRNNEFAGILHAIGSLGAGGSERQLVMTVTSLASNKYKNVKIFCEHLSSESECFYLGELKKLDLEISTVSSQSTVQDAELQATLLRQTSTLPISLRNEVFQYAGLLLNNSPAITHFWLDSVCIKGGIAAVLAGIPRIILGLRSLPPYHFAFHQPYMREAYRWLAKQPQVIIINNSHAGAKEYETWLGLPENTIRVIHNGFDTGADKFIDIDESIVATFKQKYNIPGSSPVIGTVIRFSEEKRPIFWVEIANRINQLDSDIHFLLVGDGPMLDVVKKKVKDNGLNDVVHFAGRVSDVYDHISSMDLFLLTSRIEGLPNVLIESQLLGVPVVTTRAGGASETLINNKTGWLLEDENVINVASQICSLIHDKTWLKEAGHAGKAYVEKTFGIENMSLGMESIYKLKGEAILQEDNNKRFEFGKNWESFIMTNFSNEVLGESKRHLLNFLDGHDLKGKSFLDVGCGSGLHSLAALDAGAAHVSSFDYDPISIKATNYLKHLQVDHADWKIEQASILDDGFINNLPLFDIVYSWGVLHHTGDVWHALKNAAGRVKPGGLFYVALYSADVQIDPGPEFWLEVKKKYVSSGLLKRRWMEVWYIWRFMMDREWGKFSDVVERARAYKKERGMNLITDVRDWLGGWPMEFVFDDDVIKFCKDKGLALEKISSGEANTEFLFKRS